MILVDSSGWLEWFANGPLAGAYQKYFKDLDDVVTPTIVLYEVYKRVKSQYGEEKALVVTAQMGKTAVVPLTDAVALTAADVSLAHRIAMADSIVYATALSQNAQLVTSDSDLGHLPGVVYLPKRK